MLKESNVGNKEIENKLKNTCEEVLLEYMRPVKYVFFEALPLTAVGKVDYKALEKMN